MKRSFKLTVGAAMVAVVMFGSVAAQTNRGTFTDSRDNQTYRYVTIGNQTWMAENLNFATSSGSWCYDNNESNCNTYGRLYDWNTARTVCPAGWRLPSDDDWEILEHAVGGSSTAGTKLKSETGWFDGDEWYIPGTDDYGFSAFPGGTRVGGSFYDIGQWGYWWTATEKDAASAWRRLMYYINEYTASFWNGKINGLSVRCVMD